MSPSFNSNTTLHLGSTYDTSPSHSARKERDTENKESENQQAPTSTPPTPEWFASGANALTEESSPNERSEALDLQFPDEFLYNYPPVISKHIIYPKNPEEFNNSKKTDNPAGLAVHILINEFKKSGPQAINSAIKVINLIQYSIVDRSYSDLVFNYCEAELRTSGCKIEKVDERFNPLFIFIKLIEHFATHRIGGYFNYFSTDGINRTPSILNILNELNATQNSDIDGISYEKYSELIIASIVVLKDPTVKNYTKLILKGGISLNLEKLENDACSAIKYLLSTEYAGKEDQIKLEVIRRVLLNVANSLNLLNSPQNPHNQVFLHFAVIFRNKKMFQFLIQNKVKLDIIDKSKKTPLHYAVNYYEQDIFQALINAGASLDTFDYQEKTPLYYALENANLDALTALVKAGAVKIDKEENTPLHYAVKQGARILINILIKKGASLNARNKEGKAPLHYAADNNIHKPVYAISDENICDLLIDANANVNVQDNFGDTPLHYAVMKNKYHIFFALINAGARLDIQNKKGETPLKNTKSDIFQILIKINSGESSDIIGEGNSPLHYILKKEIKELYDIFPTIVSKCVDLDIQDNQGKTPLHIAVEIGNTSICQALVRNGASVDIPDTTGKTSLEMVAKKILVNGTTSYSSPHVSYSIGAIRHEYGGGSYKTPDSWKSGWQMTLEHVTPWHSEYLNKVRQTLNKKKVLTGDLFAEDPIENIIGFL